MNSPDPWRVMQGSPPAATMVLPTARWGHPFFGHGYPQGYAGGFSPAWEEGLERGTSVFVGAEPDLQASAASHRGLAAEVAPAVAPATGALTARVELDDRQRLHVAICVDGKCYETSADLAPAIAAVLEKFARYHADLHERMPAQVTVISGDEVIWAVDRAVGAAGDLLVGTLVDRHVSLAGATWLDDVGGSLKTAGIEFYRSVLETIQKNKGPITDAAAEAAAKQGDPSVGPAAAQLVEPVIDTAANFGKDTPAKAAAEQKAKMDPLAAAALAAAKDVAAKTIAAYHVRETAKQAAAGQSGAQQKIAEVVQDAERGDPVARAAAPLVAEGFSAALAARRSGSLESSRQAASQAAWLAYLEHQRRSRDVPVSALGYLRQGRYQRVFPFRSHQEARGWLASLRPAQYNYVALFGTRNFGTPLVDKFGTAVVV